MAAEVHDHVHLDTDNPPTAEYPSLHGTLDWTPQVAVVTEHSLTGKLHVHRLVDDEGAPVQYRSDRMRLKLSLAKMLTVKDLAGKTVYFAFNYHDDNENGAAALKAWPDSDYVVKAVLQVLGITNLNPKADFWFINIGLEDEGAV